jgi:hypothetical protein
LARTVALLSVALSPCRTSGPVLKLSPSTAQFMPRNWLVAAAAGDETPPTAPDAANAVASAISDQRVARAGRAAGAWRHIAAFDRARMRMAGSFLRWTRVVRRGGDGSGGRIRRATRRAPGKPGARLFDGMNSGSSMSVSDNI